MCAQSKDSHFILDPKYKGIISSKSSMNETLTVESLANLPYLHLEKPIETIHILESNAH
jgi:hypothetical protein